MLELAKEMDDEESMAEGVTMLNDLADPVRQFELQQMLSGEADESDAIVEINSGAGGTDASDGGDAQADVPAVGLLDGFQGQAGRRDARGRSRHQELHHRDRRAVRLRVPSREIGVHRLVRISPFDSNARRHTAFASVAAYPQWTTTLRSTSSSRISASTPIGHQARADNVNTTDSAVRITHLPTNIVVSVRTSEVSTRTRRRP